MTFTVAVRGFPRKTRRSFTARVIEEVERERDPSRLRPRRSRLRPLSRQLRPAYSALEKPDPSIGFRLALRRLTGPHTGAGESNPGRRSPATLRRIGCGQKPSVLAGQHSEEPTGQ